MKDIVLNYGIPECLYTDYRTVFKSPKRELSLEEEIEGKEIKNTRFANMLNHLGTDIISTIDPRSKGRIERLWRTFQDRLYKELKKKNITTLEKANLYLNEVFLPKYNSRFAFNIDYNKYSFIKVDNSFDFNKELALYSEHKVYHNSYLRFDKSFHIILDNNNKTYLPTSNSVKVYTFVDGSNHVLFNDKFYDLKSIKDYQIDFKKCSSSIKTTTSIKPKSNNSPWRKGLPPLPSHKQSQWAYFNAS